MSIALLTASSSAMAPPVSAKCLRNSRPPGICAAKDNGVTRERAERLQRYRAGDPTQSKRHAAPSEEQEIQLKQRIPTLVTALRPEGRRLPHVCSWHKADIACALRHVRFQGQSRHSREGSPTSASDPTRTKLQGSTGLCSFKGEPRDI